jgi:NAD-dependent dihydropyrimidine dehydrogenase PreA subunit
MKTALRARSRPLVRGAFAAFVLLLGARFYAYVQGLLAGAEALPKPHGVEGFIPVAALVGLKHWVSTGDFDPVHPAGLVILLSVTALSFAFAKAFCGWLCPFGTACEGVQRLGRLAVKKPLRPPRWLDAGLRSLKYLLLAAFLYGTQVAMDAESASAFLHSPYNLVADAKMLAFLAAPGGIFLAIVGATALANLLGLSLWCRYLCPYGALLGLAGWAGPGHIRRDATRCIDCGRCSRSCPNGLPVAERAVTRSPECHFCGRCVEACPAEGALAAQVFTLTVPSWAIGVLFLGAFWGLTVLARLTGHWQSAVPADTVREALRLVGVAG